MIDELKTFWFEESHGFPFATGKREFCLYYNSIITTNHPNLIETVVSLSQFEAGSIEVEGGEERGLAKWLGSRVCGL